jgi:hypothetical protein
MAENMPLAERGDNLAATVRPAHIFILAIHSWPDKIAARAPDV